MFSLDEISDVEWYEVMLVYYTHFGLHGKYPENFWGKPIKQMFLENECVWSSELGTIENIKKGAGFTFAAKDIIGNMNQGDIVYVSLDDDGVIRIKKSL